MARKTPPLNIKNPDVYRLAKALSRATGESLTEVVRKSLAERWVREQRRKKPNVLLLERLMEISDRCAARPVLDPRSDDEIAGYDEHGVPRSSMAIEGGSPWFGAGAGRVLSPMGPSSRGLGDPPRYNNGH